MPSSLPWRLTGPVLMSLLLAGLLVSGTQASVVGVIKSSPGRPDVRLSSESFVLKPGETAIVINDDNSYYRINGPFQGTASAYVGPAPVVDATTPPPPPNTITRRFLELISKPSADSRIIGGMRGGERIDLSPAIGGSDIDIDYPDTQCYVLGRLPKLWREKHEAALAVWLATTDAPVGQAAFDAGVQVAAWPGQVRLDEGRFLIMQPDGTTNTTAINLKRLVLDPDQSLTFGALLDAGCEFQAAIAYLRTPMDTQ